MRIIIAGGRDFENYELLEKEVGRIIEKLQLEFTSEIEIISGVAKGADILGETYANQNTIKCERFPADWKNLDVTPCVIKYNAYGAYNALAGTNRNQKMADYTAEDPEIGVLIAFWDGKSKGTKDMINRAKTKELKVYVVNY